MFVFTISYLPSRIININYLNQCVRFELVVSDKLAQDQFKSFGQNLKLNLESKVQNNPFLVVLLMDFNSKSSNWFENDTTASEGKAIEKVSPQFGLHEVINEPTNILESSSCFDLIFTSQPNLITESSSIHLYILILITRSFLQNLTWKFFFCHLIFTMSGTAKMQILIILDDQVICLIGTELS